MTPDNPEKTPPLKRELAMVRRNWVIVLICVLVAPIVAYVYSKSQTPEYSATSSLLFTSGGVENRILGIETAANNDPAREAATNLKLASLQALSVKTAKALPKSGLSSQEVAAKVSVSPEGESELIAVTATDADPAFAARLANEFSDQFVAFSRSIETAKIRRAQKLAEAQLNALPEAERGGPTGSALSQRIIELETLATIPAGRAEVAQEATVPESPSSPSTKRNVALGVVVGILLAIAAVVLREQFDRRIREPGELESIFGVPVVGTIPENRSLANLGKGPPPDAVATEAFRILRTNLRYFHAASGGGSLMFTSGAPKDGKTVVSWNVARAEAAAGKRVLVIEADLRRPTLASYLGLPVTDGLGLVLIGAADTNSTIQRVEGVDLLAAGSLPPNPADLLESRRMSELLAWAESNYDRVIIDTPPATVVADALPLVGQVKGVVVVARLKQTDRDTAEHLHEQLVNLDAPVLGIVFNGGPAPAETGYYRSPGFAEPPMPPVNGNRDRPPSRRKPSRPSKAPGTDPRASSSSS